MKSHKSRYLDIALVVVALTAASQASDARGEGFQAGQLLIADNDAVYQLDPDTGVRQTLASGTSLYIRDLVYNPVTRSAFMLHGNGLQTEVLQLTWNAQDGYRISSFVSGLCDAGGLAVDKQGNLYFGDTDSHQLSTRYDIYRATPSGQVSVYASAPFGYLYTPRSVAFSPDQSKLYVATLPDNDIDILSTATLSFSKLDTGLNFPRAVEVGRDGTVYVVEEFGTSDVLAYPGGASPPYELNYPWTSQLDPWSCLACDSDSGTLYVSAATGNSLYAVHSDGSSSIVAGVPYNIYGMDVVSVPEASTGILAMLGTVFGGVALWRSSQRARRDNLHSCS